MNDMKITITVPDTNKCNECKFLRKSYKEMFPGYGESSYHCSIFQCKIGSELNKCIACEMCGEKESTNNELYKK